MRRKLIKHFLTKKGLTIAPLNGPNFKAALGRLKKRNIAFNTIIDVGASNGCWSIEALKYFPQSRSFCIEAQAVHEPSLRELARQDDRVTYVIAAAGDREGEINFDTSAPFGGAASEKPFIRNNAVVKVTTIDTEVARKGLRSPFLVKLDTHGFELQILAGARKTLEWTSVLIVECYNFKISETAVQFHQFCSEMERIGFRCIDLFDPLYRPGDEALWQMDLVFIRSDCPEFQSNSYS